MKTAVRPGSTPIVPAGTALKAPRRKQRCWIFRVYSAKSIATEIDLLKCVRERYTTVKRLVARPAPVAPASTAGGSGPRDVIIEVQFTGPQPSEGPGVLLRDLLRGSSVAATPVELRRGRKKRARTSDTSSRAGSDSDPDDGESRMIVGHRSTSPERMDEGDAEEESPGGGRYTPLKTTFSRSGGDVGRGTSPLNCGEAIDTDAFGGTSVGEHGAIVAPPSSLRLRSSDGSSPPSGCRNRVGLIDVGGGGGARTTGPGLQPSQNDGKLSADFMLPRSPKEQEEGEAGGGGEGKQHQYQQGSSGSLVTGETQWEDVVGRIATPDLSDHSMEVGSANVDTSGSQPTTKPEFERMLVRSNNGTGTWSSSDGQMVFHGATPLSKTVRPPRHGWVYDPAQEAADKSSGDTVGLSHVSSMLRESEGGGGGNASAAAVNVPDADAAVAASYADGPREIYAGAATGGQQKQGRDSSPDAKPASKGHLPMEEVVIKPSRNQCDFEGRPLPTVDMSSGRSASAVPLQCHLVFDGLEMTGQDLCNLRVAVHFGVDSEHKVGKLANPIQVGADGRAISGVFYPSMQEIWPALYSASNVRVVEVDLVIEVRSEAGEYQFMGPQLKVTYLRATAPTAAAEAARAPLGRQTALRAPIRYADEDSEMLSCVDYSFADCSCADWLSGICRSVFRGSATAHQPLDDGDYPDELMSVDA